MLQGAVWLQPLDHIFQDFWIREKLPGKEVKNASQLEEFTNYYSSPGHCGDKHTCS